jgi:8-oxo-dGTP pyrophosphatase MutT (NUDIX family)
MSSRVSKTLKAWQRLSSQTVYSCRIFSLREDHKRSPRTGQGHDFYVLEAGDWVNIIPLTADEQVVLIRQYRHGVEDMTLEIPGGMVDAEDPSPLHAARREMQEETGYDSHEVSSLGAIHPNPAIQANRCHSLWPATCKSVLRRTLIRPKKPRSSWSRWPIFQTLFAGDTLRTRWWLLRFTGMGWCTAKEPKVGLAKRKPTALCLC